MSGTGSKSTKTQLLLAKKGIVFASVIIVFLISFFFIILAPRLEHFFLVQAGKNQSATLNLAIKGLRVTLERYEPIPNLIAARPEVRLLFAEPNNEWALENAYKLLSETAIALRASEVFLEDIDGNPIIAVPSSAGGALEGRGKGGKTDQLAHRPYFNQAVAGGLGQFYALGTTDGARGFFYAAPVRVRDRIRGLVTIKFDVKPFEATWGEGRYEIIVRDSNDIIFMSSRSDWHMKAMSVIPDETKRRITAARQFPVEQIEILDNKIEPLDHQYDLVSVTSGNDNQTYIASTALLARAGWRVTILTPTRDALTNVRLIAFAYLCFILLAAMFVLLLWQRRLRLQERIASQKLAQEQLEQKVQERTSELKDVNRRLVAEIEERTLAEQKLRQTQSELIQAGKLAALGQMSAAISHEINQPLAAIKAYAENSITFLSRNMHEDAQDNVRQISKLADRISKIAKHLRNFARRPQDKNKTVPLLPVIDDTLSIMMPKISTTKARIIYDRPDNDLYVIGGDVRLQQVFVNLISNGLDAAMSAKEPQVTIQIELLDDKIVTLIRDNGPGLSDDAQKMLFDPFYTTKELGRGLGLGLSISFNIIRDFGGHISAQNHAEGGAEFRVDLVKAPVGDLPDEHFGSDQMHDTKTPQTQIGDKTKTEAAQ